MTDQRNEERLTPAVQEALRQQVLSGQSRRGAAAAVGVAPSAVSKCFQEDVSFAEALRAAEQFSETELLTLMRKHCEKSWQATRWMLECKRPERYCKRKGNTAMGPSADDVFDAVIGVLAEEIADERLRERIEARLDSLAVQEFVDAPPATPEPETPQPQAGPQIGEPPRAAADDANSAQEDQPVSALPAAIRQASPGKLVEPAAARAWLARSEMLRKQREQKKRLRKLRNRDRKRQLRRQSSA